VALMKGKYIFECHLVPTTPSDVTPASVDHDEVTQSERRDSSPPKAGVTPACVDHDEVTQSKRRDLSPPKVGVTPALVDGGGVTPFISAESEKSKATLSKVRKLPAWMLDMDDDEDEEQKENAGNRARKDAKTPSKQVDTIFVEDIRCLHYFS
jgi:hypothetical protein